jgi:DNA polymerase III delta subunit
MTLVSGVEQNGHFTGVVRLAEGMRNFKEIVPKIDSQLILQEIKSGSLRQGYWIYGPERMRARNCIDQILKAHLGEGFRADPNLDRLEASEVSAIEALERSQGMSLFGGRRAVLVTGAEQLKGVDEDTPWPIAEKTPIDAVDSVVIFWSKSFDGRKKTSKKILKALAVVECAEIAERDREPEIERLARAREVRLTDQELGMLIALDPWSLDLVDRELDKLTLWEGDLNHRVNLIAGVGRFQIQDAWIDSVFLKKPHIFRELTQTIAEELALLLPLLGLLSWNQRELRKYLIDPGAQRSPFLARKFAGWKRNWSESELDQLGAILFRVDWSFKSSRKLMLGCLDEIAVLIENRGRK